MKTEASAPVKARPVVVWERRGEPKADNVIILPANGNNVEREAAVTEWTIGSSEQPAVITQVSSGFGKSKAAAVPPQSVRMSMAA